MTVTEFILSNIWGLLIGGATLFTNIVVFYVAVRMTLKQIVQKLERVSKTLYEEVIPQINSIKIVQAERLGYERAMREYTDQHKGNH